MSTYKVTLQKHDAQAGTVEVEEVDYHVQWDPEKVGLDEIARACAAEHTCAAGFIPGPQGGTMPRTKCIGLSARAVELEEELADVTGT